MKATRKQAEAGAANLAKWQAEHPGECNLQHGINSFLCGKYTPEWLREQLDTFEREVINDLGGDVTMAQRVLIANAGRAYGVVLLGWDWIERHGIVTEDGDGAPVLGVLVSHMNSLRLNLVAVGLKRAPKQATDLEAIIAEHSR